MDAGLDRGEGPPIVAGRPTASTLSTEHHGRLIVDQLGPVHTYVFIAPEEELQKTQFKYYPRTIPQETMCRGDMCGSVANAVYITPQELADRQTLVDALTAGLGLPLDEAPQDPANNGLTPDTKRKDEHCLLAFL
ncbi:MAG: hypothetical protein MI924_07580 [Chloroflexales bacterium]|nr:hypothetical protein [Chloroflexales bacterium]